MKWPLLGGFGPLLPQILFNLAEILTRNSVSIRKTQCLKNPSKFWILAQMERTQSLHFCYILGPNLQPGNQKILLKTNISVKTTSLGISNNISPRSQKSHWILVKLSKKTFFGPKLGLNCRLGPNQMVIWNSHIAYNRTIHPYFLDAKFQLLRICCFWLYLEETTLFLVQDPIGPILGALGAITPINNVRLRWNFDHSYSSLL